MLARFYSRSGDFTSKAAIRGKCDRGPAVCKVVNINLHLALGNGCSVNILHRAGNYNIFALFNGRNFIYGNNGCGFTYNSVYPDFLVLIYIGNGVNAVRCRKLNTVAKNLIIQVLYIALAHIYGEADAPACLDGVVRCA